MSKHRRLGGVPSARIQHYLDIQAWSRLLPSWRPTLEKLNKLDDMPIEFRGAVRRLARDWDDSDSRWDVLLAVLEWTRRDERLRAREEEICKQLTQIGETFRNGVDHLQVREDHVAGEAVRPVPGVREEGGRQAEDLLPDGEPVQQGQGDGSDEDPDPDPERGPGAGAGVVEVAARVHVV